MCNNIAILLGAGSSEAAGFPSTKGLTDLVLSGQGVTKDTDGSYYITGVVEPLTAAVQFANSMVRRLHAEAERYYSAYAGRPTNYEDICYLALQARDELSEEMENPAIRGFVNELKADMSPLVKAANEKNEDPNEQCESDIPGNFETLLNETCKYIADVVSMKLRSHLLTPELLRHLDSIKHACNSVHVTSISTLCHDTHVETFLRESSSEGPGIALSDGFDEEPKNGVRYWNGDFSLKGKIPFLKLHGSIDWSWYPSGIGIPPPNSYSMRTKTPDDKWQYAYPSQATVPPLLLIGTLNKIPHYSSGIFRELHHRFRSTISDASRLFVCGYSFGDKGINEEIFEWVHGEKGRRLVIIHPDPKSLVANARREIQNNWNQWEEAGSIGIIPKRFECIDIAEFKEVLCP